MLRRAILAATMASCLPLLSAHAQEGAVYRDGLPQVLPPQQGATPAVSDATFSAAYKRAGRPRLVVYWMRRLADEVKAPTVTREETAGALLLGAASTGSSAAIVGGYAETREHTSGVRVPQADDRLAEEHSAAAESAFMDGLMRTGVRLVDRSTIIRRSAGKDAEQSAAEIKALSDRAEVLVEVTASGYGGHTDLTYRVAAIRTSDGRVLASVVLDREDLEDLGTWESRKGGGYRKTTDPDAVGSALASRLRDRLAQTW
jgi:hypothetical protein